MKPEPIPKHQLTAELQTLRDRLSQLERNERKHQQAEERILHRLSLEKALAQVSRMFVSVADVDLNRVLRLLGKAVAANRAYIFLFRENGQKMDNVHEWCDPRTEPQKDNLQNLDSSAFPWWVRKLKDHENIMISDVDALPEEAKAEKAILQIQKIRSLVVVPISYRNGPLYGFMGFDDTEKCRVWSKYDVRLLRVVSEMIQVYFQRKRAEEALRKGQQRLRAQYQGIPIPTYTWQRKGEDFALVDYNVAAKAITHGKIDNFLEKTAREMYRHTRPDILDDLWRCFNNKEVVKREMTYRFKTTGEQKRLAVSYAFVPPDLVMVHTEDISERKRLEAQLLWSQKMETVGRLAGGVAHEFNNLLTVILMNAELAIMRLLSDNHIRKYLDAIVRTSDFASKVVGQLLTLSRRQLTRPQLVNLSDVLLEIDKMLRPLIGEEIELITLSCADLGRIRIDLNQIEQVLVNLVVNARDAMPDGGKLSITATNVTINEAELREHGDIAPGEYVTLVVRDSGIGMSEEVRAHLFEPFFTTKEVGKGTGLGLATCYGIIKQSGGHIAVESAPHQGTTVKIYLPRAEDEAEAPPPEHRESLPEGTETVMLIEDEPAVRELVAQVLRNQGYTVIEAASGAEALQTADEQKGRRIDLLMTDVVMAEMNGALLAERLKIERSGIKVLFFSGHTDETILRHGVTSESDNLLQKPFSPVVLARKVREVLDR